MSNLSFICYPDAPRSQAHEVSTFDEALHHTIQDLYSTMREAETWCLSGPQVGINQSIIVLSASEISHEQQCFINPKVIRKLGQTSYTSDCLYFPGVEMILKRPQLLEISYMDETGKQKTLIAEDGLAAILAYQIDCLKGVLVIDHMSKLKRDRFLKKYALAMKHHACGTSCSHDHA